MENKEAFFGELIIIVLSLGKLTGEILVAYHFENINNIERISLSKNSKCTQTKGKSETLKSGELMFKPVA